MSWVRPYRNANSVEWKQYLMLHNQKLNIIRLRPNENKTVWSLVQVPKVQGQLIALNPK